MTTEGIPEAVRAQLYLNACLYYAAYKEAQRALEFGSEDATQAFAVLQVLAAGDEAARDGALDRPADAVRRRPGPLRAVGRRKGIE